ncbi:MAG: ribbon-helix-helix domain-containing protein [Candidatus Bathyarchaeota archaeon]
MGTKLKNIMVQIPERFLQEFDSETKGLYASRNEAIRAGMMLILETHRKNREKS